MSWSRISLFRLFSGILFISALMVPARALAVPASPELHVLEQPDGTKFNAVQWGDENLHGWETEDGYTIVFEQMMNRWTYARQGLNGNLVGTSFIAGKDAPPEDLKTGIRPHIQPAVKKMLSKEKTFASLRLPPSPTLAPQGAIGPELIVAPAGAANVAAVLINFSDRTTTFTTVQFNTMLFGTGNNSFADYYKEVSYNKFSVVAGPSSLQEWYTAPNTHNYYGSNNTSRYNETNWPLLAKEAAQQAVLNGFDFTAYDTDSDCMVDVLAVIHQGPGQESTGNVNDIWSHRSSFSDAGIGAFDTGQICQANPARHVVVDDYIIMPEKYGTAISTIGVFAHEYGHSFGLPDLYDTDYTSAGIGVWSLMAAGSWNKVSRPGDRPSHMDAWCKYALGWVTPTKVTTPLTNQPISAASTTADVYQLLNGTAPNLSNSVQGSGEYFLVENRQKDGFDAGLPGAGLLIWHIDETQSSNDCAIFPLLNFGWFDEQTYLGNLSCSWNEHYHVALVEADNRYQLEGGACYVSGNYIYCSGNYGDAGDPFPGSAGKRLFSEYSNPNNNSNLYHTNPYPYYASDVIITDISDSGPIMTASMTSQPVALTSTPSALANAVDNPVLNASPLSFSGTWGEQQLVTFFGGSAAQSGAITDGQYSELITTITGTFSISYSWKVSSQPAYDYLKLTIDGVEKARISGETRWQQKWFTINGPTTHTVKWIYVKNGSVSKGMDAGWVDNIVVNQYTSAAVLTPNGGEKWAAGSSQGITWNAPAAGAQYRLYYTVNGGLSWVMIADNVPGNSYSWSVPPMNGNKTACKVKVVAYTATGVLVGTDTSNANFTIEVLKVNYPNTASDTQTGSHVVNINYTLNSTATPVARTLFYYTQDAGLTWKLIGTDTTNVTPGTYDFPWTVPAMNGNKTACKVKVVAYTATGVLVGTDTSNANFTIEVLKVTAPNGGEPLTDGTGGSIDYTLNSTATPVTTTAFYYTLDAGLTWKLIGTDNTNVTPGTYSYPWTIPAVTVSKKKCKVKVVLKSATGAVLGTDVSDGFFTINPI